MDKKFVKSFVIRVTYYFAKGKTASRDINQMYIPKLNGNMLQIDDRGEFYIDDEHFINFIGISSPVIQSITDAGIVYVTLAKFNKSSGTFEIGVESTIDELCRLRTPIRN